MVESKADKLAYRMGQNLAVRLAMKKAVQRVVVLVDK
jgi:hypothetical protein